ncbi:MAG: hypothetical protein M3509_03005 [Chloroflexota bacterium]|nr:hypothetical protein [Chloroflexota bacterium]
MRQPRSWRDRLSARVDAASGDPASPGSRLASFRRLYRWLNLTLVHQGAWPLLILLAGAPAVRPAIAPFPWAVAATAAPAIAALLALVYILQRGAPGEQARLDGSSVLRDQARLLLFGVVIVLAIARIVIGPALPTAAFLVFGVADVLAFQLIHFGVVAGSFGEVDQGQAVAVLLFGLSWGFRELSLAGVGVGNADLGLAFVGGVAVGVAIALLSRLLRRWPGGLWAGAAGHWLVIYLVVGFAG